MTHVYRSDPLELRVLAALTTGSPTAADVAVRLSQPEDVVAHILDGLEAEQAVTRLDASGTTSYALTPKGLQAVGIYQGVQGAVDGAGHVDLAAATRMVVQQYAAARDVAEEDAVREQAGWPVDDATRDRVSTALNDAYARGALTREQLDDRTSRALGATTMGELRAAGDGVVELPPALPTGLGPVSRGSGATTMTVNPALKEVRWLHAAYAAGLVLVGLVLLSVNGFAGLAVLVLGVAAELWVLRPLLRTGTVRVRTR